MMVFAAEVATGWPYVREYELMEVETVV